MKKYKLSKCVFEITRRCNKKCLHCMRGDAEDATMPKWVIDKAVNEIASADHIIIGNGEPLLEIERIGYLVEKINNSDWTTIVLELTTNGTISDERIIDIFELFCNHQDGRCAFLRISNDEFHNPEEFERAHKFYKMLAEKANERIAQNSPNSRIYVLFAIDKQQNRKYRLSYEGRAVDYINSTGYRQEKLELMSESFPLFAHEICKPHRIKIVADRILCALNILASGGVSFFEPVSYTKLDALSIGNLEDKTFSELVEDHNDNCVVLCSEECVAINSKNVAVFPMRNAYHVSYTKLRTAIMERIFELRQLAKERYSNIPAQDIIDNIQFPSAVELYELIMSTYEKCPYYTENMLVNLKKCRDSDKSATYLGCICTLVLKYWSKGNERKYPYWLFGNDDDIEEFLSQKFEELEEWYANHGNNSIEKMYICNADDIEIHDISYENEDSPVVIDYSEISPEDIKKAFEDFYSQRE